MSSGERSEPLRPRDLGAAVEDDGAEAREQERRRDPHLGRADAAPPVPAAVARLGGGEAVGERPVVVDVEVVDPAVRRRLLGVGVGDAREGGEAGLGVAAGEPARGRGRRGVVERRALEGVPGLVLEKGDRGVRLVPVPVRVRLVVRVVRADPRLAVDEHVAAQLLLNPGQRLLVGLAREVDAEAVYAEHVDVVAELVEEPPLRHRPVLAFDLVPERADVLAVVAQAGSSSACRCR